MRAEIRAVISLGADEIVMTRKAELGPIDATIQSGPYNPREDKNKTIVGRLSSEIYTHRHAISRTEAIDQLGLEQVVRAEDAGVEEELWQLYLQYRDCLSLD